MTAWGVRKLDATEYFVLSIYATAKWVASLPEPAVVGMAMIGILLSKVLKFLWLSLQFERSVERLLLLILTYQEHFHLRQQ